MIEVALRKTLAAQSGTITFTLESAFDMGSFTSLTGPSGSGKTSFLLMLAGLMTPDHGHIIVDGVPWFDSERRVNIPPEKRSVGFVFQDYSLFPHMTVYDNVNYATGERDVTEELLAMVGLNKLRDAYPETLSGGQQQRVALARGVARRPRLLLLDEPLSALDTAMRRKLQEDLAKLHTLFGLTTFLVSHDMMEIFTLSTRTLVLAEGVVQKDDAPINIYLNRKTSQKFAFTGEVLRITKADIVYIALISVGAHVIEAVLTEDDVRTLAPGDKVFIGSKAFNPTVTKVVEAHA